jgi:uncharacterized protein YndB with AHSA1/START domain
MDKLKLSMKRTGETEYTLTCLLEAAPEMVYKVFTDPILLRKWWGSADLVTRVDQMDLRPGGTWRFVQHDPTGKEYTFHGQYQEVAPHQRLVYTFEQEDKPGKGFLETITFTPQAGNTLLTELSRYQNAEDLEAVLAEGMEEGMTESMHRFAALLLRNKQEASDESSFPPGLSNPTKRALAGAGIESLEQLTQHSESEISMLHGVGPSALELLKSALQANGLTFKKS